MVNISKIRKLSNQNIPGGTLMILSLILTAICIMTRTAKAEANFYIFAPGQSIVVRSGGIAGLQKTLAVTGQFQLSVDKNKGTASFDKVDAKLIDEAGTEYSQSFDELFNMTGLTTTVLGDDKIEFEGKTADGTESNVNLSMSFRYESAYLNGTITPPLDSADMYFYYIHAETSTKYAGGIGDPDDPYLIASVYHLMLLSENSDNYDKHVTLIADIDLSGYLFDRALIAPDTDDVNDGFQGIPFSGVFDGNGHTILNISIEGDSYLGLFGQVGPDYGATISNLSLEAVNVTGTGDFIGGLVGCNEGSITASHCTGTVTGNDIIGGLAGINLGEISACSSDVTVVGTLTVGGLSGLNFANPNRGRISTSCSAGIVSGERNIGGLVGVNQGQVGNCFSTASVSGAQNIGGLAGANTGQAVPNTPSPAGLIFRCYSTGTVDGNWLVGGLLGEQGLQASIESSFWDIETSGHTTSPYGTGKTTVEIQTSSTYLEAGWDFAGETENGIEDIWWILEGQDYPRLSWEAHD